MVKRQYEVAMSMGSFEVNESAHNRGKNASDTTVGMRQREKARTFEFERIEM